MGKFVALFLLFVVTGCTSQYKISEEALRIQQSLTDDEAMNKLVDYISPTSTHVGLCRFIRNTKSNISYEDVRRRNLPPPRRQGTSVVFFGTETIAVRSERVPSGIQTTYSVQIKETTLDLTNITRIHVIPEQRKYDAKCSKKGYNLIAESRTDPQVRVSIVNVGESEIHGFIASLRKIVPQIEIIESWGF
jgi:hypothetical protein